MEWLTSGSGPQAGVSTAAILEGILLSFALCQAIAFVYVRTYGGLSYSRAFVHSLILGGIVSSLLMLVIGNNIALGLGMLGMTAIVRFRSAVRDTRDLMFVFVSLAVGIAVGVQATAIAVIGTLGFCAVCAYLVMADVGSRSLHDGMLRFQIPSSPESDRACALILRGFCDRFTLAQLNDVAQGGAFEHCYHVRLKDPSYRVPLVAALGEVPGLTGLTLHLQETNLEI